MSETAYPAKDLDRLWRSVEKVPAGCWIWNGPRQTTGHGTAFIGGRTRGAHRVVYELLKGAIPAGLELDHLCRNPPCVSPDHLEPVTHRENLLRGNTIVARNAAKTHCPSGHEYSGENLRFTRRQRVCVTCHRDADRRYKERKRNANV